MYLRTNIQRKVGLKKKSEEFFFFILRDFCCCFGLNVPTTKESAPEFGIGARGFSTLAQLGRFTSVCRKFHGDKKKIFFPWVIINYTHQIILLSLLIIIIIIIWICFGFVCLFVCFQLCRRRRESFLIILHCFFVFLLCFALLWWLDLSFCL